MNSSDIGTLFERGHVYFLTMHNPADAGKDFGLVKVGITWGDVAHRVAKLQTGNPYHLVRFDSFETSCPREVEHFVHRDHAGDMQQGEWIRCSYGAIPELVLKAKTAARHFEDRKAKEQTFVSRPSNGRGRRATPQEFELHRDARKLHKELVPAELQIAISEHRLKAATGATLGIDGIVRVKYVPAAIRFSSKRATLLFPELAQQCRVEKMRGTFRWRKVPRRSQFSAEDRSAREACAAAQEAANAILTEKIYLAAWTSRDSEMMTWHDEFLKATRTANRIQAELADLQTELTICLGDYEALDGVCSFKRYPIFPIDRDTFCKTYRQEATQCAVPVLPQLRKYVYPSRSYL